MDNQEREAREMTKNLPPKERIANFWYYKKWWVIAGVAAVLVIALTIYEIFNIPQYDALVGMFVENAQSEETILRIEGLLEEYSNDVNEDGNVDVSVSTTTAKQDYGSEDASAAQTKIMSELNSGENDLYIVDQAYYDFMMKPDGDYAECFKYELNLSENAEFVEKTGLTNGTYYLLVRDLYPADEGSADARAAYNNAVAIYMGLGGSE